MPAGGDDADPGRVADLIEALNAQHRRDKELRPLATRPRRARHGVFPGRCSQNHSFSARGRAC